MQNYGFFSLLPPIIAIAMAFITKQTIISLFSGVLVGALMLYNWNPVHAIMGIFEDSIIPAISDPFNANILVAIFMVGAFSLLIERGGGASAFADRITHKIKTRRQGNILTWIGGHVIFFCDATNAVLLGPIFRPITDKIKISREKLAYNIDSTCAPVPALLPISGWGIFIISIIDQTYSQMGISGDSFSSFMKGIPYQYYTIGALAAVLIFAITGLDYGPMKEAEDRALYEGKPSADDAVTLKSTEQFVLPEGAKPSHWDMLLPLVSMLVIFFALYLYTGDFPKVNILEALANGDTILALNVAFLVAGLMALVLTIRSKVFNFDRGWKTYIEGYGLMVEAVIVLVAAWSIGSITGMLGTADYIVAVTGNILTPTTMLIVIFVSGAITSFITGTSWGIFAMFIPIAIPLAVAIDAPIGAAIGAAISGGIFGDHCSPISDTTILSSMGTSCDHIHHVKTQLPYAITIAIAAGIGYIVAGLTNGPILGLIVTLGLILATIIVLGKREENAAKAKRGTVTE